MADTFAGLTSLDPSKQYIIDAADIYSSGKSLAYLVDLLPDLPDNISLSLKFGLQSSQDSVHFTVRPRSWQQDELYRIFIGYTKLLPLHRIHSFQLHALPDDPDSAAHALSCCHQIKESYPSILLGISNIEAYQFNELSLTYPSLFSFVQIHANVFEQRLTKDFSTLPSEIQPAFYIANRVQARGLINVHSKFMDDMSSRFNTSPRVRQSFSNSKACMLNALCEALHGTSISLLHVAYSFVNTHILPISPIHGGRSFAQLRETLALFDNFTVDQHKAVESILASFSKDYSELACIEPVTAFER
jgi:aryl-alcohol dehydrogenase-like predicted oxidoreductase